MYHPTKHVAKKKPQPSPLKKEQMKKDLGLDDLELSFSSDFSSDNDSHDDHVTVTAMTRELDRINETKAHLAGRNAELQRENKILRERLDKEMRSKRARIGMVQKACSDSIGDKSNLILDLQEMLDEKFECGVELKVLTDRIECLHDDKAALHEQLINAQIEYEERIQEEIFSKCPYCRSREENTTRENNEEAEALKEEVKRLGILVEERDKELAERKRMLTDSESLLASAQDRFVSSEERLEASRKLSESSDARMAELEERLSGSEQRALELSDERDKLAASLASKQAECSKLTDEAETGERDRKGLKDQLESMREELNLMREQKNFSAEGAAREQRLREELTMKTERLEEDKLSLKSRIEEMAEELSAEVEKSQKRHREMSDIFECESHKLHQLLDKQQKRNAELHEAKMAGEERGEVLTREGERARIELAQMTARIADYERQLAAQRDAADEQRERLARECSEQRERADAELHRLAARIGEVEAECEEKSSSIQSLELRLSGSEERLGAAREEAEEFRREVEEKSDKVRSLVEVLRSTNEKFLAMEARIGSLEAECAGKGRIVRDLNERIGEMRTGEQERDATIAVLNERIRTEALESEERIRELRDQLGSLQGSFRSSVEEREEMELALERKKDEMTSVRKELADVIVRVGEMEEGKSREIETHKTEARRLRAQLAEKERLIRTVLTGVVVKMRELPLRLTEMRSDVERFADVAALHSDEAVGKMRARLEATVESYGKMVARYRKEMQMRKRLHNELIELRGNIRVFVRVRPRIETDPAPGTGVAVTYDPDDDSLLYVSNHRGKSVRYEADKVFRPAATQEEVYREVKSLVQSCMDGYNVCVFAYGQTGSGKTYTMEGERDKPGINERALSDLFSIIEQRSCQWQHEVTVSLLEIYNESLRDLLSSSSEKLDIRMNPDGTLKVSQLVARTVKNIREVNELFETGRKNRATACTNMNERSSRSHAVLVVNVSGTSRGGGGDERRVSGRLNLIDLAGSERVSRSGASGDRLREAQNINRSLSALGDVIQALRNKQPHVPFRNSKLTYLLQDSLSNDSKTLMLVQVSPSASSASETICSLAFAQRVRAVELAVPHPKKPPQQQSKQ